jgi:hypothetical protein
MLCHTFIYRNLNRQTWAYGKEKIKGVERNLPDFFGLCPEKLSKIVVHGGGEE